MPISIWRYEYRKLERKVSNQCLLVSGDVNIEKKLVLGKIMISTFDKNECLLMSFSVLTRFLCAVLFILMKTGKLRLFLAIYLYCFDSNQGKDLE